MGYWSELVRVGRKRRSARRERRAARVGCRKVNKARGKWTTGSDDDDDGDDDDDVKCECA